MNYAEPGDIIYWCQSYGNVDYRVEFGIVDEVYHSECYVEYLVPRDRQLITCVGNNKVPVLEFECSDKWHKLPKGWPREAKLYEISYADMDELDEKYRNVSILDPVEIKQAYEDGYLVRKGSVREGHPVEEITKEGYRISWEYPSLYNRMGHYKPSSRTIRRDEVCKTYKEAHDRVEANVAEFERQAALSDYDWNVERLDKVLDRAILIYGFRKSKIQEMRDWALSLDGFEDLDFRTSVRGLEYKRPNQKKWRQFHM